MAKKSAKKPPFHVSASPTGGITIPVKDSRPAFPTGVTGYLCYFSFIIVQHLFYISLW